MRESERKSQSVNNRFRYNVHPSTFCRMSGFEWIFNPEYFMYMMKSCKQFNIVICLRVCVCAMCLTASWYCFIHSQQPIHFEKQLLPLHHSTKYKPAKVVFSLSPSSSMPLVIYTKIFFSALIYLYIFLSSHQPTAIQ